MINVKPIYVKLLTAAIAAYVIGTCVMLSELYSKIGEIEHVLSHISSGHGHKD